MIYIFFFFETKNFTFKGICYGDSGGPLMKMGPNNHHEVIGVASNIFYGIGCCGQSVYVRTSAFLPWITRNMEKFQDPHYEFYVTYEQIINPDFTYKIYWMHEKIISLLEIIGIICSLVLLILIVRLAVKVGCQMSLSIIGQAKKWVGNCPPPPPSSYAPAFTTIWKM